MNIKRIVFITYFFIQITYSFANNSTIQTLDSIERVNFPIDLKLSINIHDLNDLEIKNNFFNARLTYELISPTNLSLEVLKTGLDIEGLSELIDLNYFENIISEIGIPTNENDSIHNLSYHTLYAQFDHNWNVRQYPFDNPQLKIKFNTVLDSSFISLNTSDKNFTSFSSKMENLKDGFTIKSIDVIKDYLTVENDPIDDSENARNKVLEVLTFYINVDRSGSWLYLKLFLGSFLSFLISWLVFFIPKADFGSRIELSVGAIFGSVGNRAYVESIMPDVQVFTKADMVNNTVILLIIFNIIIILIQRNKLIELEFFEGNKNSAIYTALLFILLNSAILLW